MNNQDTWWVYKLFCLLAYGSHPSISYPTPGYVHVMTAELCAWQGLPSVRFRKYLKLCQEYGMIEDLKISKGLAVFKVVAPAALKFQ